MDGILKTVHQQLIKIVNLVEAGEFGEADDFQKDEFEKYLEDEVLYFAQ